MLEVRLAAQPGEDLEAVKARFEAAVDAPRRVARLPRPRLQLDPRRADLRRARPRPPRRSTATSWSTSSFTGTTDARAFVVHDDTPATCYGPIGANLHAPDEWVDLQSVQATPRSCSPWRRGVVRLGHHDRHALLREAAHRLELRHPPRPTRSSSRPARPAAPTRRDRAQHRRVVAHGHAVHAEHPQLAGDHARHRHRHRPRRRRAAGRPARAGRACAGTRPSSRTSPALPSASRDTCAPPPVTARIDATTSSRRPPRRRARAPARASLVDVDRDHARARRRGDHHRGQADAAAAVDRDPLARAHAGVHVQRRPGRHEAAAQRRRLDVGQRRRHARRGSGPRAAARRTRRTSPTP